MRQIGETIGSDGHSVGIDPAPDNMAVRSPLLLVFDLEANVPVQS